MSVTRPTRPALERLEARDLPALFGMTWPDAQHLTISFAPDGTATALGKSQLGTLLGDPTRGAWQQTILRACQSWAVNANVNFTLVRDSGKPLGSAGPAQGSPDF